MSRIRMFLVCAVAMFLVCASSLSSQQAAFSPSRIVAPLDESKLVTLKGGISGRARAEFDRGRAQASTQLQVVRLVLSRSQQQEAALEKFMAEQIDPSSPNYHHWLTPQEFGKLYGPSDADIDTLVTWLESKGLTVEPVAPGRINIAVSGSVAQIEAAFHTEIHTFDAGGEEFLANVTDPSIPVAFAPVVSGVAQLGTLRPRPLNIRGNMGTFDTESKRLLPVQSQAVSPSMLPGSGNALYVTPSDAATIYNSPNSLNFNNSASTSYTGAGVTIGVGGDSPIQASTVVTYRSKFIGDSKAPTITNVATKQATDTSDQGEAYLDTELAGGLAPGATIHYYASSDLFTAIQQAITDNTVDIFSLSFGACEKNFGSAGNQLFYQFWQEFAAQGVPVLVSTGDSGSAGCDNPNTVQIASRGLGVNALASTPYNIAVGGTDYYGLLTNFGGYTESTNRALYRTAKGYIPESTWNDSVVSDGLLAQNSPRNSNGKTNIVGGSGGKSSCATFTTVGGVTTCSAGYPKPSWQSGSGVPNDNVRDLPDISLMAGDGVDHSAWLVCTDDTFVSSGVTYTTNCADVQGGGFAFTGFGGTSTSAPAFAGILALVQESAGGRMGTDAVKKLYDLAKGAHASSVFHDITQGNISVYCTSGTADCATNSASYPFLTGYDTTTGYDLATGLGTVDVTQLIANWALATGTATATVTVTPASTSVSTTQTLSVTVAVSGASGTPTGSVQLKAGTYTSAYETLDSGSHVFTIPAGSLSPASNTITASYSGDSTYAVASGSSTVTVSKTVPTVTVTPVSTSVGGADTGDNVTITVSGGTGVITPTGTMTLTATGGYSSGATALSGGGATITVPLASLPNGTVTLTASYSGDDNFATATGSSAITVHVYTPTVQITIPQNITTSSTLTLPVTVTGVSSQPTPTGNISLGGVTSVEQGATLASGTYTYTFAPGSFQSGTVQYTLMYHGDSYYKAVTQTGSFAVSKSTATVTIVPSSTSIRTNESLTVTGTVTGSAGTVSGFVNVSGGGYTAPTQVLSNGSYSLVIPAGSLAAGTDTLTASYTGDTNYNAATGSATVTVIQAAKENPTVTVTPSSSSVGTGQPFLVTVLVTGSLATPTGTVTVSGGGYSGTAQTLTSGAITITIPANTLTVGTDTLTATYSGDGNYNAATGTASVTVSPSAYSLAGSAPAAVNAGASSSSTITVSSTSGYAGSVAVTCALTTSPSGATKVPTCSVSGSPVTLSASATNGTTTVNFLTTAATAKAGEGAVAKGSKLFGSGAATLVALLVFLGMPARRKAWRALLGVFVLVAALATLSACGSGGSGGGGGGGTTHTAGTSSGDYVFTITGTGTPAVTPVPTTTVTLHVN